MAVSGALSGVVCSDCTIIIPASIVALVISIIVFSITFFVTSGVRDTGTVFDTLLGTVLGTVFELTGARVIRTGIGGPVCLPASRGRGRTATLQPSRGSIKFGVGNCRCR